MSFENDRSVPPLPLGRCAGSHTRSAAPGRTARRHLGHDTASSLGHHIRYHGARAKHRGTPPVSSPGIILCTRHTAGRGRRIVGALAHCRGARSPSTGWFALCTSGRWRRRSPSAWHAGSAQARPAGVDAESSRGPPRRPALARDNQGERTDNQDERVFRGFCRASNAARSTPISRGEARAGEPHSPARRTSAIKLPASVRPCG
jgi:hypothetical protein